MVTYFMGKFNLLSLFSSRKIDRELSSKETPDLSDNRKRKSSSLNNNNNGYSGVEMSPSKKARHDFRKSGSHFHISGMPSWVTEKMIFSSKNSYSTGRLFPKKTPWGGKETPSTIKNCQVPDVRRSFKESLISHDRKGSESSKDYSKSCNSKSTTAVDPLLISFTDNKSAVYDTQSDSHCNEHESRLSSTTTGSTSCYSRERSGYGKNLMTSKNISTLIYQNNIEEKKKFQSLLDHVCKKNYVLGKPQTPNIIGNRRDSVIVIDETDLFVDPVNSPRQQVGTCSSRAASSHDNVRYTAPCPVESYRLTTQNRDTPRVTQTQTLNKPRVTKSLSYDRSRRSIFHDKTHLLQNQKQASDISTDLTSTDNVFVYNPIPPSNHRDLKQSVRVTRHPDTPYLGHHRSQNLRTLSDSYAGNKWKGSIHPIDEDFVKSIKEKYSLKEQETKQQICEALQSLSIDHEDRVNFQKTDSLLQARQRLKISRKEPPPNFIVLSSDEESVEEIIEKLPEITAEMNREIDSALFPNPTNQVLSEAFNITITRATIHSLSGLNWLNDEIINFYMNLLAERSGQNGYARTHCFNTFFYEKLSTTGYSGVRRWTKRVDIFSFSYVVVPVHLGIHWCLAVIDFKRHSITYYDSMKGKNTRCLNILKNYLSEESLDKKKQKFDDSNWKFECVIDIPEQMNGSDCGVFVCVYADYITRDAPLTFSQDDMPYFRRRMVYEILHKRLL